MTTPRRRSQSSPTFRRKHEKMEERRLAKARRALKGICTEDGRSLLEIPLGEVLDLPPELREQAAVALGHTLPSPFSNAARSDALMRAAVAKAEAIPANRARAHRAS